MDKNYWKEAYKEYWEISSKKEIFVKELIESKTGFKTLEVGLGAGSEDFLSGSASDYGLTKGDADLYVGEFYQFNLSSCIRQQNSLTAQFVSFSLSNLANIFYPSQFLQ